MSATIEASQWESFLRKLGAKVAYPAKILQAAMSTRGFGFIIKKFKEERGPNGPWEKRSAATNKRYEDIRAGGKQRQKLARRFGSVESAYATGVVAPSSLVNGVPRSSYRASNRLLQLTGNLRKSIMPASLARQTDVIDRDKILIFSPIDYSAQHDEGLLGLPQRKFMWLDEKEKETVASDCLQIVAQGLF